MEVEAHEKKGHRAFAKAIKSLGSHRRSNCDLDKMCGKDALYTSDKTFVQPKQVEGVKTKVKSDLSKEAQPARGAQSSLRKELTNVSSSDFLAEENVSSVIQSLTGLALLFAAFAVGFAFSIADSRDCLMQILQLEKHLKDQQVVRDALEKALGPDAAPVNNLLHENPMPGARVSCKSRGDAVLRSSYPPPPTRTCARHCCACVTPKRSVSYCSMCNVRGLGVTRPG
ncbi:hypothetical protein D1007_15602 [Hordeum vulgare]|nr:hypothetical protein D1007_15602 [Hordeum vulgare]